MYNCPSVDSANAEPAPKKAIIHIQNNAPGPPQAIAVATPAILPVPIRPAKAVQKPWKDEIPSSDFSPANNKCTISLRFLT